MAKHSTLAKLYPALAEASKVVGKKAKAEFSTPEEVAEAQQVVCASEQLLACPYTSVVDGLTLIITAEKEPE